MFPICGFQFFFFNLTINGLTAEFYQTFFDLIGSDLVDVINYASENEKLTLTMRRSIRSIVFIWKDNPKLYLKEFGDFITKL